MAVDEFTCNFAFSVQKDTSKEVLWAKLTLRLRTSHCIHYFKSMSPQNIVMFDVC